MTITQTVKANLNLHYEPILFHSEINALRFAGNCQKLHLVVLGENGYWISCFADAIKLENAGYEIASKVFN